MKEMTEASMRDSAGMYTEVADIYSTVFGFYDVQDTLVGDAAIREISGGEKKHVS